MDACDESAALAHQSELEVQEWLEDERRRKHAAYMREWRKTHPLTPEQKKKDNCRSYANVYKKRGKLIPQPCECGSTNVEMHHVDYDKPLQVVWMCRKCHLEHHRRTGK